VSEAALSRREALPHFAGALALAAAATAAAAAARGDAAGTALVLAACLVAPWLVAGRRDLARCLRPERTGWWAAAALAAAAWLAPFAATAATVRLVLGGMVMLPASPFTTLAAAAPGIILLAFGEELLFRAALQEVLLRRSLGERRWGPLSARCAFAAMLFAAAHLPLGGWPAAAATLATGVALGWLTERSGGSIWPAVALHAAGNLAVTWNGSVLALNLPLAGAVRPLDLLVLLLGG